MTIAVICTGLLGLLIFGLGFGVSMTRASTGTNFGYTPDPADRLYKMVRAHSNTAEYAPMLAVLMLLAGARNPATWVLWVMVIVTLSRYLLALGLIVSPTRTSPTRSALYGRWGLTWAGWRFVWRPSW